MKEAKPFSQFIQHFNQRLILDALSNYEGPIAIVWDDGLIKQLDVVLSARTLAAHNVVKNLSLRNQNAVYVEAAHFIYFISPCMPSVELLIKNFVEKTKSSDNRLHHVMIVPEVTSPLQERLKADAKIASRIESVTSLPLHWFPTEQPDFLHLAQTQLSHKMLIDGDWNFLYKCAVALLQLENLMPETPIFYSKGEWSARIVDMLKKNRKKNESKQSIGDRLDVDSVVIMDRWLDPLSPLLTQFTFGGAIDELFATDVQGKIRMPLHEFEELPNDGSTAVKEINLHDEIYEQLQDLHVNAVGGKLKEILKDLREEEDQQKKVQLNNKLSDYKMFVAKLPQLMKTKESTSTFTKLAMALQRRQSDFQTEIVKCEQEILANVWSDKVIPFVENSIIEARPCTTIMRLIALQSLAANGLKPAVLQAYKKLFIQSYGIYELQWWLKLQIAGLLRCTINESRFDIRSPLVDYQSLAKSYRLNYPEVDEVQRSDISYAYNGRASLLVRYLEDGIKNSWQGFTKTEEGNGKDIESKLQKMESMSISPILSNPLRAFQQNTPLETANPKSKKMLFVVGGLTRAEISSIQLLSKHFCLICTTTNINGDSFLNSFRT
uniref:Uncharacterized protein n=1 Tax=Ditylenchus dipsaci TaxID=166011 RepID=A0A915EW98_9BILA